VGVLRAIQFAAAAAIVLWPAGGWAQSGVQADFTWLIFQKIDARSEPAKVTTEDESALTSKGYTKIGTIKATQPGKKVGAEVTEGLRAAALSKAASAGGDVVCFSKEGALEVSDVPTGKTKTKKRCEKTQTVNVFAGYKDCIKSCHTDSAGNETCINTSCSPQYRNVEQCVEWGVAEEIPITKREQALASEGTVWRYDPKLAADIARAAEAAREAENSYQALEASLTKGQDAEVESLLAHGADVNEKNRFGETHLQHFSKIGKDGVKFLLAHGADVNVRDTADQTPLHIAASFNYKDVAELLLAYGADVNAKDNKGITPLYDAVVYQQKEMIELLLSHGADVNAKSKVDWTPLRFAESTENQDIAKLLQEHVLLIAHGGEDAAREAAKEAYRKDEAAREDAPRKAEADKIAFRPWKSLNFEAKDGTPRKQAELLLAHGADVNARDEWGDTPLHKAASDDNKELTALLLAHGANVNARDDIGHTPLHSALYKDESELLLAHGADVNAKDNEGKTPLHHAASDDPKDFKGAVKQITEWDLARIELLLAHGADVNAKDNDGRTPLFYAKIGAIAKLLREHGGQK
jgi:ankyrin repeat protein